MVDRSDDDEIDSLITRKKVFHVNCYNVCGESWVCFYEEKDIHVLKEVGVHLFSSSLL